MINKERQLEYGRKYYQVHKEQIREKERRGKLGSEEISASNRHFAERRKRLVLTHYGNGKLACVKCGESRLACLSIDHINAIGAKGRRGIIGGTNFYAWLIKNNYPLGYQTLCMNCQWVKRYENSEHGIRGQRRRGLGKQNM